jgi:N-carbamoyl-L-amino-acid hydrolase
MNINGTRLVERLHNMAKIGKTSKNGVHRLALTEEDKAARNLFVLWLKDLRLDVRVDDFGNIFGRKEGKLSHLPPVVIGSHLDSVPNGGKFDGTLGVLAALEVIQTLTEEDAQHDYPIEIAMFTNEEGARYATPMLGSGGMTGVFEQEYVYQMKDEQGLRFIDELKKINYHGDKEHRLQKIKCFVELHIEQGPVLIENKVSVGIVKGIQGLSWHKVTFIGESDHAGTTPMNQRKDAFVSAIKAMYLLHHWVKDLGDETAITFGKCSVNPNVINVIPRQVSFSIDVRHPDEETLIKRIGKLKEIILNISTDDDVESQIEDISLMQPVQFSERLVRELENLSRIAGFSSYKMYSGAGHDAMYMNRLGETVMIFVPSLKGKSHCEEEESCLEDIYQTVEVLYQLIKKEIVMVE